MGLSSGCPVELKKVRREDGKNIQEKSERKSSCEIMEETMKQEVKPGLRSRLLYAHGAEEKAKTKN